MPSSRTDALPVPPEGLSSNGVVLRFVEIRPGDPSRGFVPYYHFRIVAPTGVDVGHINFRVGDTEHVRLFAGHIGFEIAEAFRGHGFAEQACRAIAPFAATFNRVLIITCDPENLASKRTIERLGAEFVEEIPVSKRDPHFHRGSRLKRRYQWQPC